MFEVLRSFYVYSNDLFFIESPRTAWNLGWNEVAERDTLHTMGGARFKL